MSAPNETTVSEAAPELSRRFGDYQVLTELAHGGMSRVHLARRAATSELCVVKQLKDGLLAHEAIEKRFQREAALCAMLAHPGIARVFDSGIEAGALWIAMELIPGQTIADLMREVLARRAMIPAELALAIILRVLDALSYAHEARDPEGRPLELVHRDLSPRNLMLSYFGDVKVIDFGLARGNVGDFRTRPGQLLGTLRYISPEQARGESVDRRTDIYSCAVILFEMLAGRALFRSDHPVKTLRAVVYDPPPAIDSFGEELPQALKRAVLRGLSKDAGDRQTTAAELAAELRAGWGAPIEIEATTLGRYLHSLFPGHAKMMIELLREHDAEIAGPVAPSELSPEGTGTAITDVTKPAASAVQVSASPIEVNDPTPIAMVHTAATAPDISSAEMAPTPTVRADAESVDTPIAQVAVAVGVPEAEAIVSPVGPTRVLAKEARPRRRRAEVERLERSLRRWRNIAVATMLIALTAVTALITSGTPPPRAEVEPAPIVAPSVAVRPGVAPRPAEETPALEEPARASPAKRAKRKSVELAPPPAPAPKNELRELLASLRADPKNVALFERVVSGIEARTRELPRERRAAVTGFLNAASISGEVEGVAKALDALEHEETR